MRKESAVNEHLPIRTMKSGYYDLCMLVCNFFLYTAALYGMRLNALS